MSYSDRPLSSRPQCFGSTEVNQEQHEQCLVCPLTIECMDVSSVIGAVRPLGDDLRRINVHACDRIDSEVMAMGARTNGPYFGELNCTPVVKGSVHVENAHCSLNDDGFGELHGDGRGSINYETGEICVTFLNVIPYSDPIRVNYACTNTGSCCVPEKEKPKLYRKLRIPE